MKIRILFILYIALPYLLIAQTERTYDPFYVYENTPTSPEASTLGEYGQIDAAPYNGKANINIPVYTINFEGLQIPIQLNYDTGGVNVAADASWVGLNWNLSSSFGISRKVYGVDDFSNRNAGYFENALPNGYIYNDLELELLEGQSRPYLELDEILNVHHSFSVSNPVGSGASYLDTQPDVFNVSVFGQTYKFILNKKGTGSIIQTQVFDNNNVSITLNIDTMSFTMLDESGFTYVFSTKEVNTTFSSVSDTPQSSSSYQGAFTNIFSTTNRQNESIITNWSLDSVISPRGRVLSFEYEPGLHFTFPQYNFMLDGYDRAPHSDWPAGQHQEIERKENHSMYTTVIENNYLSKISGDFGEVIFNLEDRLDLSTGSTINELSQNSFGSNILVTSQSTIRSCHGTNTNCGPQTSYLPKRLESISVSNMLNEQVLDVQFGYSYFNEDKINDTVKERYFRLKLDEVSVNEKQYKFSYINPNSVTAKDSYGVDFWGFSNGKEDNESFVPKIGRFITTELRPVAGVGILGQTFAKYPGANRGSNFSFGRIGLLNRIVYPTGGSSSFEYEAHDAVLSAPAAFEITEYISENFPEYTSNGDRYRWTNMTDESLFNITYQYLKNAKDEGYNYFEKNQTQITNATTVVQQPNTVFVNSFASLLELNGTIQTITGWSGASYWSSYPILVAEEINSGQEYVLFTYGDAPSVLGAPANNVSKTISIPPGEYRVISKTATVPPGEDYNDYPTIPFVTYNGDILLHTFETNDLGSINELYERFEIGGARIEKIVHKDGKGNYVSGKKYEYKYPGTIENVSSSGVLMDDLIFHSKASGFHSYNPRRYDSFYLTGNNMVGGNLSAQGSHVGYSFVRETRVDQQGSSLGWIDREYHNQKNEYFKDSFCLPYEYNTYEGDGDPYLSLLGVSFKWTCSGITFGNDCAGDITAYSSLGNSCIENTVLLGLPLRLSFGHANGNVLKENIYEESGTIVNETINSYAYLNGNLPLNYYSSFLNIPIHAGTTNNGVITSSVLNTSEGPWGANHHSYYPYLFPLHHGLVSKLSSSKTIQHLTDGELENENISSYNGLTHLTTKSTKILNESESEVNNFYYPYDSEVYGNNAMNNLRTENRLSTVVQTNTSKNGLQLSTLNYEYENSLETSNLTLVTSISSAKEFNPLERKINYIKYDEIGNLLEYSNEDGSPTVNVWGYNKQYLIAKLVNASYADMTSAQLTAISNASSNSDLDLDRTLEYLGTEGALRQSLDALRNLFPNAMVSTYTYDPLIGVTSITNSFQNTSYYAYDEFNRLVRAYDLKGMLEQDVEYHFIGPDSNNDTSNNSNQYPFAVAFAFPGTSEDFSFNFSSTSSYDPDGNIASYFWDFGDGNTSTLASPYHVYNVDGTYAVSLTVTDNDGATSIISIEAVTAVLQSVFFSNIEVDAYTLDGSSSGLDATGAVLNGPPGARVTYSGFSGGQNNTHNGRITVKGISTSTLYNQSTGDLTVIIPSSGFVQCFVYHSGDGAGSTSIMITGSTIGTLGNSATVSDF